MSIAISLLQNIQLFESWSESDLQALCEHAVDRSIHTNETIYRVGDAAQCLHLIIDGKIRLFTTGQLGNPILLATLRTGDLFGEFSDVPNESCSATAVALSDTHLLVVDRADLLSLFNTSPDTAMQMIDACMWRLNAVRRLLKAGR